MTTRECLLLSWMAYLDLPPLYRALVARGGSIPVAAFADTALRMDAAGRMKCVSLDQAARNAARELLKTDWIIAGYINDNQGDGFVAYVLKRGDETVIAMRGSEKMGECAANNADWIDNVCEPFAGSVQLGEIRRIVDLYPVGRVVFTGHSKGGHNALLALAISRNPAALAVAFNGQGFSADALTESQKKRLRERAVNYVVAGDIVGALLEHPERRVYVRRQPGSNAHMPEAFSFDAGGEPEHAPRTLRSYAIEAATRLAEAGLSADARGTAAEICRQALNAGL